MAARLLLIANALMIGIYICWQGIGKFFDESFFTWVISPVIYGRLCPLPLKPWYFGMATGYPLVADIILCGIPVLMFVLALAFGFIAARKGSLRLAVVACLLMTTIFATYHSVKHMGIKVEDPVVSSET